MTPSKVTVIDYGMGNIWSVVSALTFLGYDPVVSSDPQLIISSDTLLLPGVGSFMKAMNSLRESRLDEAIVEAVSSKKRKILGICLGMQLLGTKSFEDGETSGLNLLAAPVEEFSQSKIGSLKIPHIGFDQVEIQSQSVLFRGIANNSDFYFVHSYYMSPEGLSGRSAVCNYGVGFLAAYEQENIFVTQFHPEKSQTNGLILLRNFLKV